VISIRVVDPTAEPEVVSSLVANYLRQTEREKAARGLATFVDGAPLPAQYEAEIDRPADSFRNCLVLLAAEDGDAAGLVVVKPLGGTAEIKRLWVEPAHRGKSVSSALLRHVLGSAEFDVFRLSVWPWREAALALYEKLGFERVESWEERPELICFQLSRWQLHKTRRILWQYRLVISASRPGTTAG
jgi:ribosomal protein S18 acetylase RimI-like enzyme